MAEPPQAGSMVRREGTAGALVPKEKRSLVAWRELGKAPPALAACEKLFAQPPVSWSDSEGRALADLARVKPGDSDAQREIRGILFDWLCARLQPATAA